MQSIAYSTVSVGSAHAVCGGNATNPTLPHKNTRNAIIAGIGGSGGIRTHGTQSSTTDFESVPL